MSSDGVCIAITRTGARCTSGATDANGHCAHHARMARVMALAPKPAASPSSAPAIPTIPTIPTTSTPTTPTSSSSIYDLGVVRSALGMAGGYAQPPAAAVPAAVSAPAATGGHDAGGGCLPNESVSTSVAASFVFPSPVGLPTLPGTLVITSFRLRFEPSNASLRSPGHLHRLLDDAIRGIPRAAVAKLSYPQAGGANSSRGAGNTMPTQLVIKFKDLRSWTLSGEIHALMTTLHRYVVVDSPLSLFAFTPNARRSHADEERELRGHRIYDVVHDFARMGVDLQRSSAFRVTDVNLDYSVCATYPRQLVVPASATDHEIRSVAEFRSKGRLPICCFAHTRNGASIWRCAQPKRGIFNAQNASDERYLVLVATGGRSSTREKMWIADCRPELNARANNFTGGGTESSSLSHARVSFLNIANIHAMRESIENVRSLLTSGNQDFEFSWHSRVEETKWLLHVRLVLSAAVRVADAVENKQTTVLVHCSDGWDRTGQLCALSQILLDRHYRTIVGFMQIVEKEWIRPGHKFYDRVGPGRSEHDEQSPIFLQFLDCVWQLWRQYPTYFEFNAQFLHVIADALFSAQFGTFLGNCDRERTTWGLETRTPSLWAFLLSHEDQFRNPFYRANSESVLLPPTSSLLRNVTLWTEYYGRSAPIDLLPPVNAQLPQWGAPSTDSPLLSHRKSTHEDLDDSMRAALQRIRVLEYELSLLQGSRDASSSITSPPVPPPAPVGDTPVASTPPVPSTPPTPVLSSSPLPATWQANHVIASGGWTCAICSKANMSESPKCIVCGRPPPPIAATTHL
ncbi:hypothetical protein P43SY_003444 [Pythium insidiosum]|uniref:Phosphatidylinositol-3-phosphatase n=1 Tax=Pythium insidiosum TaxID=114742 RepID=A0AAD5LY71_PYTIN|nr:hypothetical protein P43SY_003444 [Pythium insidiosum]